MGSMAGTLTAEPETSSEGVLAEMLAGVMKIEQVPFDSHFFDDLGADSLVMAKFCARVRKAEGLPVMSMKDIYANPTIKSLATQSMKNPFLASSVTVAVAWIKSLATQISKPVPVLPGPALTTSLPQRRRKVPLAVNFWTRWRLTSVT